jgi:hypothetical protein
VEEKITELHFNDTRPYRKNKARIQYSKSLRYVNLVDLIDLTGIGCAVKLITKIGGYNFRVPHRVTIKRRFMHAAIRDEWEKLKGTNVEKAKKLAKKYNLTEDSIGQITGERQLMHKDEFEKYKAKLPEMIILDKKLLEIMKMHWSTLNSHGLV